MIKWTQTKSDAVAFCPEPSQDSERDAEAGDGLDGSEEVSNCPCRLSAWLAI
jgi:hypothetical protein